MLNFLYKKGHKKGFTIVELVIAIAVIAILAAVLIPTFSGVIQKANASNDIQMIKNLNTTLKTDETLYGKPANMYVALSFPEAGGYSIDKIEAKATGNLILWDSVNNYFCYLNNGVMQYPGADNDITQPAKEYFWALVDTIDSECEYSQYLRSTTLSGDIEVRNGGFDAGNNTSITSVTVNNSINNSVTIRTNGGNLIINAPNADVIVSGTADTVTVQQAAPNSVHILEAFIRMLIMEDSDGHVEIEEGTQISRMQVDGGNITIETGSKVIYFEANSGSVTVEDASTVTKYYTEGDNLVSGTNESSKLTDKKDEVASCGDGEHIEEIYEVGGNRCAVCKICGEIINVERVSGGTVVSGVEDGESTLRLPSSITISGDDKVDINETITLTATVLPSDANNKTVTWSSNNENIATVDENGVVTGKGDGDVIITATSKDQNATNIFGEKTITVIDTNKSKPESISITGDESVVIGNTIQLSATVAPNGSSQNVSWSSSDTNIATVDSTGKVMGVSAAEVVTITATSKVDSTIKGTFNVKVDKPAPTSITINIPSESVIVGGTLQLHANINPVAAEQTVTWTSADANIATINESGLVTGVTAGEVIITATSTINNNIKDELTITVIPAPETITISGESSVLVGNSITLTANVEPDNTIKIVTWASSDPSVATVDTNGKVTAKKAGSTTITATTTNGKTDTKPITVNAPFPEYITISGDSSVVVGSSISLKATVTPNGANQSVIWSSSNSNVATIDSTGKVTGVASGTVTIYATTADNSRTTTKKITVSSAAINATGFGGKKLYQVGTDEFDIYEGGTSSSIKYYKLNAATYSFNNYRYVLYNFKISADYVYIDLNGQTIIENEVCNDNSNDNFFVDITGSHVTITNGTIITSSHGIKVEGQDVTIDCDVISNVKLSYTKDDYDFYTLTNTTFTEPKEDYSSPAYAIYVEYGGEEEITSAKITGGSYKVNMNNDQDYTFNSGNGDTYTGCYSACVREYASLTITGGTFSNPIITRGTGYSDGYTYKNYTSTLTINGGNFGTGTLVYLGANTSGKSTINETAYYHGSNINNILTINGSAKLGTTTGRSVYNLTGSGNAIEYTLDIWDAVIQASTEMSASSLTDDPFALVLTYYDTIYTRGFSWMTKTTTNSGMAYIVQGVLDENSDWNGATELTVTSTNHTSYYGHQAHTGTLSPATTYSYKVGTEGNWKYGTFTTEQASVTTITAIQLSDAQTKDPTQLNVWENTMAQAIETAGSDLDMVLYNGDHFDTAMYSDGICTSYSSLNRQLRYGIARDTISKYLDSTPYMSSSGNHEGASAEASNVQTYNNAIKYDGTATSGAYYSYDYGLLTLLC